MDKINITKMDIKIICFPSDSSTKSLIKQNVYIYIYFPQSSLEERYYFMKIINFSYIVLNKKSLMQNK